jgi:apolipoprotein N-acyltransferase
MKNNSGNMSGLRIIIAILALLTAGIHLTLLFPDLLFILNGLGYLALLAAYLLPIPIARNNRGLVRWAFIGFTVVTIVAWLAIGVKTWPDGALGYATKIIEVLLVIALLSDRSQLSRQNA